MIFLKLDLPFSSVICISNYNEETTIKINAQNHHRMLFQTTPEPARHVCSYISVSPDRGPHLKEW